MPAHCLVLRAVFLQRNYHIIEPRSFFSVFWRVFFWHYGKLLKLQVRELIDVIMWFLQVDCWVNRLTSIELPFQSLFLLGNYLLIKTIDNYSKVIIRKGIQYLFCSYYQCLGWTRNTYTPILAAKNIQYSLFYYIFNIKMQVFLVILASA